MSLGAIVALAERNGVELPVTLIVSGKVVTGITTPKFRFDEWFVEIMRRAELNRGKPLAITGEMPELSPAQLEKVRSQAAQWDRDNPGVPMDLKVVCLRNAEVVVSANSANRLPFLVVRLDQVSAYTIGDISRRNPLLAEQD
jgi:hypothetical protein